MLFALVMLTKCSKVFSIRPLKTSKKLIVENINFNTICEKTMLPLTDNQQKYYDAIKNENTKIIFCKGPAGTGKTLVACMSAVEYLKNDNNTKIIISRSNLNLENENIGFLPGNINQKMAILVKPVLDIFKQMFPENTLNVLLNLKIIEIIQICNSMKGHSYENAFIIVEEVQNTTPEQIRTILTRLGKNSKMILTGDLNQTNIKGVNGLEDFLNKYNHYTKVLNKETDIIKIIEMTNDDIKRSEGVKIITEIYDSINIKQENDNDCAIIPKNHQTKNF